ERDLELEQGLPRGPEPEPLRRIGDFRAGRRNDTGFECQARREAEDVDGERAVAEQRADEKNVERRARAADGLRARIRVSQLERDLVERERSPLHEGKQGGGARGGLGGGTEGLACAQGEARRPGAHRLRARGRPPGLVEWRLV